MRYQILEATRALPDPFCALGAYLTGRLDDLPTMVPISLDVGFEFLVESLTALCLAEASRWGTLEPTQLGAIARPKIGSSLALCESLLQGLPDAAQDGLLAPLMGGVAQRGLWQDLRALLSIRNRWAHADLTSDAFPVEQFVGGLVKVLEQLDFLSGTKLEARGEPAVEALAFVGRRTDRVEGAQALRLVAGGQALDLDPWMFRAADTVFVIRWLRAGAVTYYAAQSDKVRGRLDRFEVAAPIRPGPIELPEEAVGRASTSLERVVRLIRRHLDRRAMEHLDRRFEAMGLSGSPEGRLIEYCLERDLREVLEELFSEPALHDIARELGLQPDPLSSRLAVTGEIFGALGIPLPAQPFGLDRYQRELLAVHRRIDAAPERSVVRGLVTEAATLLEQLQSDLVRFYGAVMFAGPPQEAFQREGWLQPHQHLDRASMGLLFELLTRLDAEKRREELFESRPRLLSLTREDRQTISKVRNAFSHPNRALEEMQLLEVRRLARSFTEAAARWLEALGRDRAYPRMVAVSETVSDAFGRRFVRAVDADGTEEKIFTHREMEPGALYFMHPLTDPVRIFPILVKR